MNRDALKTHRTCLLWVRVGQEVCDAGSPSVDAGWGEEEAGGSVAGRAGSFSSQALSCLRRVGAAARQTLC